MGKMVLTTAYLVQVSVSFAALQDVRSIIGRPMLCLDVSS